MIVECSQWSQFVVDGFYLMPNWLFLSDELLSILGKSHIVFFQLFFGCFYFFSVYFPHNFSAVHDCQANIFINWDVNFLAKLKFRSMVFDWVDDSPAVLILFVVFWWQVFDGVKLLNLVQLHQNCLPIRRNFYLLENCSILFISLFF